MAENMMALCRLMEKGADGRSAAGDDLLRRPAADGAGGGRGGAKNAALPAVALLPRRVRHLIRSVRLTPSRAV